MRGRTLVVSGSFMVEARAFVQAEAELAGPGKNRSVRELDAELAVLARLVCRPLGPGERARLRGRSAAIVAAMRDPNRPAVPARAGVAGSYGECPLCGAPVLHLRTGGEKSMPVDPLPAPDGNLVRTSNGTVRVLKEDEITDLPRHWCHYDACSKSGKRRRRAA